MTDSLISPKATDGFTTESPIRAFTDFKVNGRYAIGKGFRPSMAHLGAYLDAMEGREHWKLLQIIMPDNEAADPTLLFTRTMRILHAPAFPTGSDAIDIYADLARDVMTPSEAMRTIGKVPELAAPYGDDPINPKHYNGTACCEIIDHMPTNVGLAAKYLWRLGEKDAIAQEIGKGIFYLDRQIDIEDTERLWKATFGFASPQPAGRYKRHAVMLINERFGRGEKPYSTERATALTALVSYTVSGNRNNLVAAIEDMRRIAQADTVTTGLAV